MSQPSTTLRPGNPTFEEGLVCARFLDTAAEGFFRILLGRRMAEIFAQAYTKPNNEYSYKNVVFAVREERFVGMALGFTAEQRRGFRKNALKESAGYPRLRAGFLGFLARPMFRILETIADDDFYLLSIAIDESMRGQGVGSTLLDSMEDRARASGSTRLALDVAAKNERARRLYERRGMTVESQWPKRFPLRGLKLYRMTRSL